VANEPGWKSLFDDKVYRFDDPRLKGCGNPPCCPNYGQANPGRGQLKLTQIMVKATKNTTEEVIR